MGISEVERNVLVEILLFLYNICLFTTSFADLLYFEVDSECCNQISSIDMQIEGV